ncbi:MAG: alpha-ketoacid dehydrogenase subunit beta [Anaerolineae bacterium]|nr:alpha-ketoacid dehydrogenase subunit beta [Anaerolineae bacterium]
MTTPSKVETKTLILALHEAMNEELARDKRVFIVGEDVGRRGGVFRATTNLIDKYGAQRVVDSPLAELSIVAIGLGAAITDTLPICEIQFADFIFPAFNQLLSEVARFYYRSNGQWHVPMVVRAPYGGGIGGGLYHSQSIESFFAHIPGLKVVVPSTPEDAKGLLKAAVRDPNPVLYLEPKKGYRAIKGIVPEGDYITPIGPANISRTGSDLTVYAYGMMAHYARIAVERVAKQDGIDVELIDIRTLAPLDKETLIQSFKKTGKALVVYEDNKTMGFGAEIAAILAEEAFEYMDAPIMRLAAPDVPSVPFSHPLQEAFMINPDKIAAAIRELEAY